MTIKLHYTDFWPSADFENIVFTKALREICDLQLCDKVEDADYVICSVFGSKKLEVPDRCITIMYTGENICPDFNLCDYALGFEYIDYGDRYMRFPVYLVDGNIKLAEQKHIRAHNIDVNRDKQGFCSFLVSNGWNANPIREKMFHLLSEYKKVSSGGRYLNNVGGPVSDKLEFESRHKFCLTFENSSHPGYTTEKIVDAFAACSVPIYWGDPMVTNVFNEKAFINVNDYRTIDDVCKIVQKVDADDELYLSMLKEPIFLDDKYQFAAQYGQLVLFFENIISVPLEKSYRRNREFWGKFYMDNLRAWKYKSQNPSLKRAIRNKLFKK